MKKIYTLSFFVFIFLNSCSSSSALQNENISGRISNNSDYKGGANPPQFILDALAVFRPSANQLFYVRNAQSYAPFSTVITSFRTDANGEYTLSLPAGDYAIISQEKYDFEQNPYATAACEYLQQPDFVINVTTKQQNYSSQFTSKANYCLGYPQ
jgi:hypothetical protein